MQTHAFIHPLIQPFIHSLIQHSVTYCMRWQSMNERSSTSCKDSRGTEAGCHSNRSNEHDVGCTLLLSTSSTQTSLTYSSTASIYQTLLASLCISTALRHVSDQISIAWGCLSSSLQQCSLSTELLTCRWLIVLIQSAADKLLLLLAFSQRFRLFKKFTTWSSAGKYYNTQQHSTTYCYHSLCLSEWVVA